VTIKRKGFKKFKEKTAGQLVGKYPCTIDLKGDCASSDAMAVYLHDDGSHSATCWSCESSAPEFDFDSMESSCKTFHKKEAQVFINLPSLEVVRDEYIAVDNKQRHLRAEVYEFYGVKHEISGDGETIDKVFYPTYREDHVGYRIRGRYPEGHVDGGKLKDFSQGMIGDTKKGIQLFGQWLFRPDKYKRLFIVEGEEDAVTGYHMTSLKTKSKEGYAFTSVPSGANIAGLKAQLEYIGQFDEIYLCFDKDKAGDALLEKAVKLLPVGKVRIMNLPSGCKDISDLWQRTTNNGTRKAAVEALWSCIWNSEKYSPAGIYSMSEGWNSYLNRGKEILIPFPDSFGDLNKRTYGGYALGEIVTIAAPSSVGKSSFIKEMIYTALEKTNYNIAICSFEETLDEFIEGMLSVHMSTQLNEISFDERDRKAEWEAFQELLKMRGEVRDAINEIMEEDKLSYDRIHFLDHQGACDGEELLNKIDFMIDGLDCKIVIVDPITLALSASDMDEDEFASEIVKRVKRKHIAWINVHHVRKNAGGQTANSEGGDIAEEDMKGSGVWFQTSMINLLLTRNKVHRIDEIKNTTTIKMSKCRRHGKSTGIVGWTLYQIATGRLVKGTDPAILEEMYEKGSDEEEGWGSED
jgi:archaellum biogenesis ATPase FlaH